ncbi:MAG: hypothetical protein GX268_00050 [Methanomicrobiales archaeon]|nr:hypothetical protein [Methanomicrobiales archaeon]
MDTTSEEQVLSYLNQTLSPVQKIERVLRVAKQYQNLGIHPPKWQSVNEAYIFAVSHLDMSGYERNISLDNLEIFADALLEDAFFCMLENIKQHSKHATKYWFYYETKDNGVSLILEDNGTGIENDRKETIFERNSGVKEGVGLFLVREIFSITRISVSEMGKPGKGARFIINIPKEACRFNENM